jgi:hypothetical protein
MPSNLNMLTKSKKDNEPKPNYIFSLDRKIKLNVEDLLK